MAVSTEIIESINTLDMSHISPTIAAELAAGLIEAKDVPEKHELTLEQWDHLKTTPLFRKMLKEALEKFSGDLNASRRITLKAEILLEEALPVLDKIVHNKEGSTQSKIDSVKQLSVLAGRTQRQDGASGGAVGGGFNVAIHINTGDDKVVSSPVVIDAKT